MKHRPYVTVKPRTTNLLLRLLLLAVALAHPAFAESGYEVVPDWPALPPDHTLGLCAGVGVDSHNDVFVFHRNGRAWSTPFPDEPIAGPTVSIPIQ